jgi:hypothetical protein
MYRCTLRCAKAAGRRRQRWPTGARKRHAAATDGGKAPSSSDHSRERDVWSPSSTAQTSELRVDRRAAGTSVRPKPRRRRTIPQSWAQDYRRTGMNTKNECPELSAPGVLEQQSKTGNPKLAEQ